MNNTNDIDINIYSVIIVLALCLTTICIIIILARKLIHVKWKDFEFQVDKSKINNYWIYDNVNRLLELKCEIYKIKEFNRSLQLRVMKEFTLKIKDFLLNIYRKNYEKTDENYDNIGYYKYKDDLNDIISDNLEYIIDRINHNGTYKLIGSSWEKYKKETSEDFVKKIKLDIEHRWRPDLMNITFIKFWGIVKIELYETLTEIVENMQNYLQELQIEKYKTICIDEEEIEKIKNLLYKNNMYKKGSKKDEN